MFRATDDGIAPDTKANDGIFSVQLPMKQEEQLLFFRSASEEESALFNKSGSARIVWDAEGLRKEEVNAYTFFLAGLPYRFYPILALVFGLLIAGSGRDFGPMLEAEKKQLQKDVLVKDPDISISKLMTAIVPLLLLVCITAADLYLQGSPKVGSEAKIFEIIGAADGYDAMLKGAIFSALSVSILALLSGTSPKDVGGGFKDGATHLFEALCILVLAWALGNAISELEAATYLVQILDGAISPALLPSIVFILAAGIAFSTGTSFGTMGTLMPLALPLAIQMQLSPELCLAVGAAVLSGATWGDHCSPISDTTILSSAGADCDHIAHVKTQLPYALAAGLVSLVFCSIPIGFGLHWGPALLLGSIACIAIIWIYGKTPETQVKQA
ncbi:MAG: Na+/H+ antiporter NhaC family protein, partial [Myxococcota bacterium]|nr:Na+/H+ antiporter NhaC family protein [Myxococcota bacterium]